MGRGIVFLNRVAIEGLPMLIPFHYQGLKEVRSEPGGKLGSTFQTGEIAGAKALKECVQMSKVQRGGEGGRRV